MKEIVLSKGFFATVDDDDYESLSKYKWSVFITSTKQYALRNALISGKRRSVYMHQQIMGTSGMGLKVHVDHIDGNGLNNSKSNLRLATPSQNHGNMKVFTKGKHASPYKGVTFSFGKWRARIVVDRKEISLGRFDNEIDAALAYNNAAMKYFKGFAFLNKIPLEVVP